MSETNSSFSQNISNSNLTIPADTTRKLDLLNNTIFQVVDVNTSDLLSLSAGDGTGQSAFLKALVNEGDGNIATVSAGASTTLSQIQIEADFNDGISTARIQATADNTNAILTYIADRHNFNLVNYADNAAALVGGLVIGDLYHTAGTVKVVI